MNEDHGMDDNDTPSDPNRRGGLKVRTVRDFHRRDAALKTLNDVLAQLDAAVREIRELNSKELRDAIQECASSLRDLIKALSTFDRSRSSTGSKKPTLVLVRQPLH
jgi:hypothetical protein